MTRTVRSTHKYMACHAFMRRVPNRTPRVAVSLHLDANVLGNFLGILGHGSCTAL